MHVSHNLFPRLTVGISMLPELNSNKFIYLIYEKLQVKNKDSTEISTAQIVES